MFTIAIVIPVYNSEKYIEKCIESLLKQTYKHYLIVLVDDGSQDNSSVICDKYAKNHNNIVYIRKENGGASSARNTGIEYVLQEGSCKWISFVDSDDIISENYLTILLDDALQNNAKISTCDYCEILEDHTNYDRETEILSPEEYWCRNQLKAILIWGKLYAIDLFDNFRYPENVIFEDEFSTHELLFSVERIAVSNMKLYYYIQSDNSVMRSDWTPKKLLTIAASKRQIDYFLEHKYSQALVISAKNYIFSLYDGYYLLTNNSDDKDLENKLKNELRKALENYRSITEITEKNYPWIYYLAFPVRTRIHCYYCKIIDRLKGHIK